MSNRNLAYQATATDEDYLEIERLATEKSELIGGIVVAMAGASPNHNIITTNLVTEIRTQTKRTPCFPFSSDMRVKARKGNYYYPDVVVVCGERQFEDEEKDVLLNPKIIIEVLSESTRLKDRNEKFDSYTTMPSVTNYILIDQNLMRVEHFRRADDAEWKVQILSAKADKLILTSINCEISLEDIYDEVIFTEQTIN